MAAIASHQPSFNYFAASQQRNQQQLPIALSPQSPYAYGFEANPSDFAPEFVNDYSNDSAPSPGSPLSLVFTNPYQLPAADDEWFDFDGNSAKVLASPDSDVAPKLEPYDSPMLAAQLPRYVSVSPAINPLELSAPSMALDDVEVRFGRGGLTDTQPLFQSPPSVKKPLPPVREEKPSRHGADRSPTATTTATGSRKRKSTSSDYSSRSSASPPPASQHAHPRRATVPSPPATQKKTTHNVIEKRYRTNLNDKIAALRDSVPSLRVMARRLENGQNPEDADEEVEVGGEEDLGGLTPAHKLNKATVLSKATEYITHLERKNKNLARENAALRDRVEGFEMLVMSRGRPGSTAWN